MIKVTEENNIVLLTNISYGKDNVSSVINIDGSFIALCTHNGIEVYNKETQELTYKIPKHLQSHIYAVFT